jgi:GNAT superfamily N-acetyltransferase
VADATASATLINTKQIEDMYVSEAHRNIGIGKALFGELARVALKNDCARIEWSVLHWNSKAIDFYKRVLGAVQIDGWQEMRLEEDAIMSVQRFALSQ